MTKHENIIQLFGGLSLGCFIWQVSLMPTVFYTCWDFDGNVAWSFGLDVLAGIACVTQTLVVVAYKYTQAPGSPNRNDAKMAATVSIVLAAFNVAAIVWMTLIWGGLVDNCPVPPGGDDPNADWKNQLNNFHEDAYDDNVGCRSAASGTCYSTLDGPNGFQLLYNPKEWCKLALTNSCPNLSGSATMERCLRYGAHGFIPVLKYAFAIDVVHHFSRLITCAVCFLSYNDQAENAGGGGDGQQQTETPAEVLQTATPDVGQEGEDTDQPGGDNLLPEAYPFLRHRRLQQNVGTLNF